MVAISENTVAQRKAKATGTTPAKKVAAKKVRLTTVSAARKRAPGAKAAAAAAKPGPVLRYHPGKGVDDFVRQVSLATPLQLIEIERHGVAGRFLKDVSRRLEISAVSVFDMLGVPKATAEKKSSAGEVIAGSGGQAAIGMAKLIAIAQGIVANSTATEAEGFDAAKWLGKWLGRSQPSLGGRKPAELIDTPTGVEIVGRLLGAIESGAYQ